MSLPLDARRSFSKKNTSSYSLNAKRGFTLIELLIVIAILTIMAAAVIAAVNPAKRSRQARDAARKQHINNIANALIGYYTLTFHYPGELVCDSTVYTGNFPCGIVAPSTDWSTLPEKIQPSLVTEQGFSKKLPIDPVNNVTYYYRYEPRRSISDPDCPSPPGPPNNCDYYWIGTRLEEPQDTTKPIFRCSDDTTLSEGVGCKEVGGNLNDDPPTY